MRHRILVVDDDNDNIKSTRLFLEDAGYDIDFATSGAEAITKIQNDSKGFSVIILDYRMPGKNGVETAKDIRSFNEESVVLMYSGDDSRETLKEALRIGGVIDFIDKSESSDELLEAVKKACTQYEEVYQLLRPHVPKTMSEEFLKSIGLVAASRSMHDVAMQVFNYRTLSKPVLIIGETGVGKESLARALHTGHASKYFPINCASFANNAHLMESQLYGYERGAFTGADRRSIGIFEQANGGTIFLDELHRMDLDAQAKLLRVLQEKKIRRVGGALEIAIDFRVIASTQPTIEDMVSKGEFLPDLYYRLNFLKITVAPLRERPDDIGPLISHFTEKFNQERGTKKVFLMSTIRKLEQHLWPGNVRELDGSVFQILNSIKESKIRPEHLEPKHMSTSGYSSVKNLSELENRYEREKRDLILTAIQSSKSVLQAAEKLGMPHTTLRSMLSRLKIAAP